MTYTLKTVEVEIPIIYRDGHRIGYGANQEWFPEHHQRYSGCASVCGANLAAYYSTLSESFRSIYPMQKSPFDYYEFINFMQEMFRYMLPGHMGYPYIGRFVQDFKRFMTSHGIELNAIGCGTLTSAEQGFKFIKKMIDKGLPVALLILQHRAPELSDDNWHWLTVTGYQEDDNFKSVILSNLSKREVRSADMLFERHTNNIIRMISFEPVFK